VTKQLESEPSYRYWRLIVDGAKEAGLPAAYVESLERLPHLPTE
jgi:AIG2 family protein